MTTASISENSTYGGKSTNFELDCKVPLLIYSPEYKDAPKRINDIVELIDIYPTIIRKTKNSSFKNEKSKKEVDVAITVSNKDIV